MRRFAIIVSILLAAMPCAGQTRTLTTEDYSRAEKFMGYNTNPLVLRAGVRPNWLPDDRFWYRVTTGNGGEFFLVDPARGTRVPAFDQSKIASALSAASNTQYEAYRLPFTQFEFADDSKA